MYAELILRPTDDLPTVLVRGIIAYLQVAHRQLVTVELKSALHAAHRLAFVARVIDVLVPPVGVVQLQYLRQYGISGGGGVRKNIAVHFSLGFEELELSTT